MRSLGKKLELATYANDKLFTFRLASKSLSSEQPENIVSVPVPIMYRFYHVGRAYDLHQLKNLQPTGSSSIDFVSIQLLVQELEQVMELIDDPVLHHYSNLLLPYLKAARTDTKDRLILNAAAG
jgi:hypothetical protein